MTRVRAPSIWIGFCVLLLSALSISPWAKAQTARSRIGRPAALACAQAANSGQFDDAALALCDSALADPDLTRTTAVALYINRGAMHLRRKEAALALADFDEVVKREPKNAEAFVNRGAALVLLGRPGQAVAALTQALSYGVREPHKAFFNRGAAREALGDPRGALEDYETALAIKPDWAPAEQELARFIRSKRDGLLAKLADPNLGEGDREPEPEGEDPQSQSASGGPAPPPPVRSK